MPRINELVTQGGADTYTEVPILTGLTADGKAGWQIDRIEAFWVDGSTPAAADWQMSAIVKTIETTQTDFGDDDEIARVSWGLQNTAGVAVAVPYEPQKFVDLFEPRVTVQPVIYVAVDSANTAIANDVIIVVYYQVVKLTDIEVLRLLAGGA